MTSTDERTATGDALAERVTHLQNAMHKLGADVIRLQTQLADVAAARPEEEPDPGEAPAPFIFNMSREAYKAELAALVRWVDGFLVPVYVGDAAAWCPAWWEHHEAVGRLHALRLAYTELADTASAGASGPARWHAEHLDPLLARLLADDGPFSGCLGGAGHVERRRPAPRAAALQADQVRDEG
ncbi:DUF4913 domain-containing protein [Nocardiopsis sp. RSe5-2]|uniref:DUF4913 domain-containing protein n=1 Tax=Nocardiopsis endophytica TaxID=3018445 RepID=A0ABT4UDJ6_9ACTN|nr:DUF4913 domain-containing protein [Nocardiopsis endophytica]MDA2814957.1 DUF4913 domain-containing protein [Nocardiopsis endophytica]